MKVKVRYSLSGHWKRDPKKEIFSNNFKPYKYRAMDLKITIKDEAHFDLLTESEKPEYIAELYRSKIRELNDRGDFRFMDMEDNSNDYFYRLWLTGDNESEEQPEDFDNQAQELADREWASNQ